MAQDIKLIMSKNLKVAMQPLIAIYDVEINFE